MPLGIAVLLAVLVVTVVFVVAAIMIEKSAKRHEGE